MKKIFLLLFAAVCTMASWAADEVTATYTSSKIDVALANTTEFVAFQMDIKADGVDLNGKTVSLNADRLNQTGTATIGGTSVDAPFVLASNVLADGTLRVIAYNLANRSLSLDGGNLFTVAIDSKPTQVTLSNVLFVKAADLAEIAVNAKAQEGADFLLGDVNKDGKITALDLSAMVSIMMGTLTGEEDYNQVAADVNNDAKITALDLSALVEIMMGKK